MASLDWLASPSVDDHDARHLSSVAVLTTLARARPPAGREQGQGAVADGSPLLGHHPGGRGGATERVCSQRGARRGALRPRRAGRGGSRLLEEEDSGALLVHSSAHLTPPAGGRGGAARTSPTPRPAPATPRSAGPAHSKTRQGGCEEGATRPGRARCPARSEATGRVRAPAATAWPQTGLGSGGWPVRSLPPREETPDSCAPSRRRRGCVEGIVDGGGIEEVGAVGDREHELDAPVLPLEGEGLAQHLPAAGRAWRWVEGVWVCGSVGSGRGQGLVARVGG